MVRLVHRLKGMTADQREHLIDLLLYLTEERQVLGACQAWALSQQEHLVECVAELTIELGLFSLFYDISEEKQLELFCYVAHDSFGGSVS